MSPAAVDVVVDLSNASGCVPGAVRLGALLGKAAAAARMVVAPLRESRHQRTAGSGHEFARASTWRAPLLTCDGLVDHTRNPALRTLEVYRWTAPRRGGHARAGAGPASRGTSPDPVPQLSVVRGAASLKAPLSPSALTTLRQAVDEETQRLPLARRREVVRSAGRMLRGL